MALSKQYLLALKSLPGIGTQKLLKIGNHIESCDVKLNSVTDLIPVLKSLKIKVNKEEVSQEVLEEAMVSAKRTIEMNEQKGIRITTYYDEDYPAILRETINEDGKVDPPMILYYKGDLSITKMPQLAVIGTREVTDFGIKAGNYLASEFTKLGFCIVSGLAVGCDTVGHKGALAAGGKTIAFLAHGLDTVYGEFNKQVQI
jgi:DNA processing protein